MRYKILVVFLLISLLSSIALVFLPTSQICGIKSGCETVQNSGYENSFGIENSYIGLFAILILLLLTISHIKSPKKYKNILIRFGMFTGFSIALYFIYLQIFVIKAFCEYCLIADVGIILGFLTLFLRKKKIK